MTRPNRLARRVGRLGLATLVVLPLGGLHGCASSPQSDAGMSQGAGAGAIAGLLIGAIRGRPLEGLAVGAAVGGASGYYDGWREENEDRRAAELADAVRSANQQPQQPQRSPDEQKREELTRFLGMWSMEGWAADEDGTHLQVRSQLRGRVEMANFVEVDFLDLQIQGFEGQVWGSATFGYDATSGYTMTTRFNTAPTPFRFSGSFDSGSGTMSLQEYDYEGGAQMKEVPARMFIQFQGPDRFTIETRIQGQLVESYTAVRN